jgi:hypothetical protein
MTDEKFAALIKSSCSLNFELRRIVADEFAVSVSTVERWATGVACPHPIVRDKISAFVKNMMMFLPPRK